MITNPVTPPSSYRHPVSPIALVALAFDSCLARSDKRAFGLSRRFNCSFVRRVFGVALTGHLSCATCGGRSQPLPIGRIRGNLWRSRWQQIGATCLLDCRWLNRDRFFDFEPSGRGPCLRQLSAYLLPRSRHFRRLSAKGQFPAHSSHRLRDTKRQTRAWSAPTLRLRLCSPSIRRRIDGSFFLRQLRASDRRSAEGLRPAPPDRSYSWTLTAESGSRKEKLGRRPPALDRSYSWKPTA